MARKILVRVSLPSKLTAQLDAFCVDEGVSRSMVAYIAIRDFLEDMIRIRALERDVKRALEKT